MDCLCEDACCQKPEIVACLECAQPFTMCAEIGHPYCGSCMLKAWKQEAEEFLADPCTW